MTDETQPYFVYDQEQIATLRPLIAAHGLELPEDPNDASFGDVINALKVRDPQLAAQASLARVDDAELHSSALLQEQAAALQGQENLIERLTKRFSRRTTNGAPVVDMRMVGAAAAGVTILGLGALMFIPRSASGASTTTTVQKTETETEESPAQTTTAPSGLPQYPAETSPLQPPPQSTQAASSAVAPTASDLSTPAYSPPAYDDSASSYTPSPAATAYTPPPAVYTPPPSTPDVSEPTSGSSDLPSATMPEPVSTPVDVTPMPAPSSAPATPTPVNWDEIYGQTASASTPAPVGMPVQVNEPGASATPAAAAASRPASEGTPVTPPRPRINTVYAAAAPAASAQRTGRMTTWTSESASRPAGSDTGAAGAGAQSATAAGATRAPAGSALRVIYDPKASAGFKALGQSDTPQDAARTPQRPPNEGVSTTTPVAGNGTKVLYSAAPAAASSGTATTESGATAQAASPSAPLPFQMGQLIPAQMVVALDLMEGTSVEFFVTTPSAQGNYVWKGTATLDATKRVQMAFTELALPNGQTLRIRATGVSADGTIGLTPSFRASAPSAAIDAVRGTLTGVQQAANAQLQAGTTVIANGQTTVSKTAPPFWMTLLGGAVNSFKLPESTASVVTLGHIRPPAKVPRYPA